MFTTCIFNASISFKKGLECVKWSLKLSNLIDYVQMKSKVNLIVVLELLALVDKVYLCF